MSISLSMVLFFGIGLAGACVAGDEISDAQTVEYCELLNNPDAFAGKITRVRALYETGFEESAFTAPSCPTPLPMTRVEFDRSWQSRTPWRLRHAIDGIKWGAQTDVVFIGKLRTGGKFGHMDMYPLLLEVYKVEAVRPSGSFRPLPRSK